MHWKNLNKMETSLPPITKDNFPCQVHALSADNRMRLLCPLTTSICLLETTVLALSLSNKLFSTSSSRNEDLGRHLLHTLPKYVMIKHVPTTRCHPCAKIQVPSSLHRALESVRNLFANMSSPGTLVFQLQLHLRAPHPRKTSKRFLPAYCL